MEDRKVIEAIYSAEGYMEAARYLKMRIIKNPFNFFEFSSAMTMNLSFAIEIYLKQLLKIQFKTYKHTHELKMLYKSLPQK